MRAIFFAVFLLAGCKTLHTLDVQQHQEAASAATTETHETRESGPEHIVMTVEEYEQLCPDAIAAPHAAGAEPRVGSLDLTQSHHPGGTTSAAGPSGQSQLLRRTVTVTDRGPSLDDLRSLSSLQSKVNTALEVKEEKKSGPAGLLGLLGGLWPVVLIGAAVLAGVVVWKLKPPWLSFLFKLLGRTP